MLKPANTASASNCPTVPMHGAGTAGQPDYAMNLGRDSMRDASGTVSLKAAANRYFSRDGARDTRGASRPQALKRIVPSANTSGTPVPDPFDAIERAAIQAEGQSVRRLRKRHVSWSRADDEPAPGDYCGCCAGQLFWSDTDPPRGWCCTTCHPPCHKQPGTFRVVAT
jgi:hypothetical protein